MASSTPMEVEPSSTVIQHMASGLVVSLHPLVTLSIADHCTRLKIHKQDTEYALGALLGVQEGREIEVTDSFDLCYDVVDGAWVLNVDYMNNKLLQVDQVRPGVEVVGWYSIGDVPGPAHLTMHHQITQVNESPILLMLDPQCIEHVKVYETIVDVVKDESRTIFIDVPYSITTSEAERIGVDHAAGASVAGLSAVADVMGSQQSAVTMLWGRIKVISDYLRDVKDGTKEANPEVMRAIASLVSSLPLAKDDADQFSEQFQEQITDSLLVTSLATLTKGYLTHDEVVSKCNILYGNTGASKKSRGAMLNYLSRSFTM